LKTVDAKVENSRRKQMISEDFVLFLMKRTEHGVNFTRTVEGILETIVERVWYEDIEGAGIIEKVAVVLNHYINFDIRVAIRAYGEMREELKAFVLGLRDKDEYAVRINTWDKIEGILGTLLMDGERFLEISAVELARLQQVEVVQ
jgi:hypothetical protein